jgi:hypothetical protein
MPPFWRWQLVGWTFHGVVSLPFKVQAFGSLRAALVATLITTPVALVLTGIMRSVYVRLKLSPERPRQLVMPVLIASIAAAAIDWGIASWVQRTIELYPVQRVLLLGFTWLRGVQYIGWSALYFWILSTRASRERAVNLVRAESAAHEAELQMLRAQIDPHFLFNSLNTVLAGLDRDPRALSGVVQGLADYLRYSLANRHSALVPLGEEYDAVMNYLVVEKARFRDDLEIDAHMDPGARAVPVPGVILQPLVENAIKHGYKASPLPLRLRIAIHREADGGAMLEVANSGRWVDAPARREAGDASGVGLDSLRRRLTLLYKDTHRFDIVTDPDQVLVRITVPPASPLLKTA